MDQLYESGLFSELGEVVGYDPVLYEDTQKQQDFTTLFPLDGLNSSETLPNDIGAQGQGELDGLLAENNQLLDQLLTASGLELPDETVDLADIDEVSAKLDYLQESLSEVEQHDDLIADLERLTSPVDLPEAFSPASIATLPSEPSSPVNLLPFMQQMEQPQSGDLTDLLESLISDDGDSAAFQANNDNNYIAELSPTSLYANEEDFMSASPYSTYSMESYEENEVGGKSKPKKKSKSTPYSKLPAGRKERKKKQNKEAAIRYREKKRREAQEISGEEELLAKKNNELKTEVLNLEREITCMKELLSDVFNIHSL